MSTALTDKITELFKDPKNFSLEAMTELMGELFRTIQELQKKLASSDEKERQEALEMSKTLKAQLEAQAAALCKLAGMNPQDLESYITNPENFAINDWQSLQNAKVELDSFKKDLKK